MEDNWLDSKLSFSGDLFQPNESLNPQLQLTTPDEQIFEIQPSFFYPVNATLDVPSVFTVYRMRGYYVAGMVHEFWTTTDPTSPNPSGNPLVSKVIDSIISECS